MSSVLDCAPTILAILNKIGDLRDLDPARVIAEIDTLSTLRIEQARLDAAGIFYGLLSHDGNGLWNFSGYPLTIVARRDVPPAGWTVLTRK